MPTPFPPDMTGPELVFLHIPKTAGTSQQNAFKEHYGEDNIFWIGKDCPPDIWRYPRDRVGGRFVVGGHKRLSFYPRSLDPLYCALVRDPVERAISLFVYYTRPELAISERDRKARALLLEKMLARGIDPGSMLDSIRNCRPFRREISNYQCRYLSRGRATLAGVVKSLRDHDFAIGSVRRYDRFHRELWDLLDWGDEAPVMVNRSRDNYADAYLQDEELVSLIAERNTEDHKLVQWVETRHEGLWLQLHDARQRRRRLRSLPLKPGRRKARHWSWDDAPELWPARAAQPLDPLLHRIMVARPCRVVYVSTPGAVDNAIQRMLLGLSSVPFKDALLALGIDRVVREYATGLMLIDRSAAEIGEISASSDYFKFAVIYEPVGRLVDIYQQRFVEMRHSLLQWPRLHELVADVQGRSVPDLDLGISFRQFVEAVASDRYSHPLWLRQSRYFPWAHTYNGFYRPDQLARLEADLAGFTGLPIRIQGAADASVAVRPFTGLSPAAQAGYADTPAGELPADPARWRDQLVDEAVYAVIKDYYAWDFRQYNHAADREREVAGA